MLSSENNNRSIPHGEAGRPGAILTVSPRVALWTVNRLDEREVVGLDLLLPQQLRLDESDEGVKPTEEDDGDE